MRTEKELIDKQIDVNKTLPENYPRFDFCNVNNCPLESRKYTSDVNDPETKCLLGKTRKRRLLREYPKLKLAAETKGNKA